MSYKERPPAEKTGLLEHIVREVRTSGRTAEEVVTDLRRYLDVGILTDGDWQDLERMARTACVIAGAIGAPIKMAVEGDLTRRIETYLVNRAGRKAYEQELEAYGLPDVTLEPHGDKSGR